MKPYGVISLLTICNSIIMINTIILLTEAYLTFFFPYGFAEVQEPKRQ